MPRQEPSFRDLLLAETAAIAEPDGMSAESESSEFMTPEETSDLLWEEFRLRRGPRRLAQLRAQPIGAGPPYHRDGCTVIYARTSTRAWARKQLGREHANTTDETAFHQRQRAGAPAAA